MALHMTGLVSRHNLAHPDEKPAVKPVYETVLKFNPNHGPDGRFSSSGGGRRGGTAGPPTEDAFGSPLSRWGRTKGPGTMGWGAKPHGGYTGKPSTWGKKQTPAAHSQEAQYAGSHVHGRTDGGTVESGALRTRTGGPAGGQFASPQTGVAPHAQTAQYAKSHMHGASDGGYGPSGGAPMPTHVVGGNRPFNSLSDAEAYAGQLHKETGVFAAVEEYSAEKHVPLTQRLYEAGAIKLTAKEKKYHGILSSGKHPGSMSKSGKPKKRSSFS